MKNILTAIFQGFGLKKPSPEEDDYSEYDGVDGGKLLCEKAENILRQENIISNLEWFIGHSGGIQQEFYDESISQYSRSDAYHWVTFYVNELKFRIERSSDEPQPEARIDGDGTYYSHWHITVKVNDEIFLKLPYELPVVGLEKIQIICNYKEVKIKLKKDSVKALVIFLKAAKIAYARTEESEKEWLDQFLKKRLKKEFDLAKSNIDLGDYE